MTIKNKTRNLPGPLLHCGLLRPLGGDMFIDQLSDGTPILIDPDDTSRGCLMGREDAEQNRRKESR
jgi:hypothetical protein